MRHNGLPHFQDEFKKTIQDIEKKIIFLKTLLYKVFFNYFLKIISSK
jgi:hypothetical protein